MDTVGVGRGSILGMGAWGADCKVREKNITAERPGFFYYIEFVHVGDLKYVMV